MRRFVYILVFFPNLLFSQIDFKKVYYLDSNYVDVNIETFFIGCKEKIVDTTYVLKYDLISKDNWQVYLDQDFEIKHSEYYVVNDTSYSITFHKNGKKKKEQRELLNSFFWFYLGEWCEDGTTIYEGNPNDTTYRQERTYYCNGNIKWEANLWNGRAWGLLKEWYSNGNIKSEEYYTEFNDSIRKGNHYSSELISSKYYDLEGNIIEEFLEKKKRVDPFAYKYIGHKELNGRISYDDIRGLKEYNHYMLEFRDSVYNNISLSEDIECLYGFVDVAFTVSKSGFIENIKIESSIDDSISSDVIKAIQKIGTWRVGVVEGQMVDVMVKVRLELEKIKEANR